MKKPDHIKLPCMARLRNGDIAEVKDTGGGAFPYSIKGHTVKADGREWSSREEDHDIVDWLEIKDNIVTRTIEVIPAKPINRQIWIYSTFAHSGVWSAVFVMISVILGLRLAFYVHDTVWPTPWLDPVKVTVEK